MDNFQPMRFGRRLWIVPSWHDAPEPDAVNLLLDPGLAFGTGTHPTTALCLEWLDSQDLSDCNVLDFGCGSGILAIAALLLGAKQAVGTDIDVQALEASRDNAGRNHIAEELFPLYLPEQLPPQQADVLVANILAGPLVALAPQLSSLVKPGDAWHSPGSSLNKVRKWPPPTPRTSIWTRLPPSTAGCASPAVGARMAACIIRMAA